MEIINAGMSQQTAHSLAAGAVCAAAVLFAFSAVLSPLAVVYGPGCVALVATA